MKRSRKHCNPDLYKFDRDLSQQARCPAAGLLVCCGIVGSPPWACWCAVGLWAACFGHAGVQRGCGLSALGLPGCSGGVGSLPWACRCAAELSAACLGRDGVQRGCGQPALGLLECSGVAGSLPWACWHAAGLRAAYLRMVGVQRDCGVAGCLPWVCWSAAGLQAACPLRCLVGKCPFVLSVWFMQGNDAVGRLFAALPSWKKFQITNCKNV